MTISEVGLRSVTGTGTEVKSQLNEIAAGESLIVAYALSDGEAVQP